MTSNKPNRPIGVTIISVLALAIGVIGLIAGIAIIGFGALLASSGFLGFGGLLAGLAFIIAGVVIFFGLIYVLVGWGLFQGKGWAYTLALIFSFISVLFAIGAAATGSLAGIGGLVVMILMVYYLFTRPVKAYFGKAPAISPGFSSASSPSFTNISPRLQTGPASLSSISTGSFSSGPSTSGSSGTRFCSNCGASLHSGQNKCSSCGTTNH